MFSNYNQNLLEILGEGFCPLAHVFFLLWGTFRRTSCFGLVIEANKTSRFPGVKPMIDSDTINLKNLQKLCSSIML